MEIYSVTNYFLLFIILQQPLSKKIFIPFLWIFNNRLESIGITNE